ncbi:hypothetical protein EhV437 [Emiliania huxleyi virus 86]|uniref:Uncharacterized protein n=1 Tax=Emiliania huxleyi virus 86 (isolate United Kingdom/English Channel/1999) TaxID=654925 RepID=Q4A242_EHV8U|nr:hypothetical protein EhV437 [Emiliania huxleyi virus 86]AHA56065.1 hypothetical protein EhV164_00478 [Emiliania huxleyi virus 164]CAI65864.1 hypothetical protein EhV437 [Emiliania huxleyi virus 86]CAZ69767.1 hypothetical protein [Emiliania huxleyi virus 99B1]|mmetsp:Transcript_22822/g.65214  ORF Transcript_22822/g.65214 Transcript_22822/m.65214 type:complete len:135 (-) Transcript_22822:1510-1914(-)
MLNEYVLVKSQKSMDDLDRVPIPLYRMPVSPMVPTDKVQFYTKSFNELMELYIELTKTSNDNIIASVIKEELERRLFDVVDNKISKLTLLVNEPFNDDAIMLYENTRQSLMKSKELYNNGSITLAQFSNNVRVF